MALYFEVNPIKSKEEYLYFVLETFYESANYNYKMGKGVTNFFFFQLYELSI